MGWGEDTCHKYFLLYGHIPFEICTPSWCTQLFFKKNVIILKNKIVIFHKQGTMDTVPE